MLLSQTRARLAFAVKDRLFRWGNFQSLLEEKELRMLTQHMGFRHQWDEHRRFQMEIIQREGLKPSGQ